MDLLKLIFTEGKEHPNIMVIICTIGILGAVWVTATFVTKVEAGEQYESLSQSVNKLRNSVIRADYEKQLNKINSDIWWLEDQIAKTEGNVNSRTANRLIDLKNKKASVEAILKEIPARNDYDF